MVALQADFIEATIRVLTEQPVDTLSLTAMWAEEFLQNLFGQDQVFDKIFNDIKHFTVALVFVVVLVMMVLVTMMFVLAHSDIYEKIDVSIDMFWSKMLS
jgi:hypothetical protein